MTAIIAAAIWALIANLTAMLPHGALHWNMGRTLVLSAPILVWLIGRDFGFWAMLLFIAVIVSLFRIPLGHMGRLAIDRLRINK